MAPNRIALFRSVNVAGHGALPMARLREEAAALGLDEAATLLQSGNLLFLSDETPAALEAALEAMLSARFALATSVMVRKTAEWQAVVAQNPFAAEAADDPSHLVVCALTGDVRPGAVEALRAAIKGPERVQGTGRHLYAVYPDGIGRSKLTAAVIERHLGTRCTGRNWNTVLKIAAALAG